MLPLACSSSCPPAPCRGKRAAGPCTAHTAACAAPTAPAGLFAPQREWPAGRRSTQGMRGGWEGMEGEIGGRGRQGWGDKSVLMPSTQKRRITSTVCARQVTINHMNPEQLVCYAEQKRNGPVLTSLQLTYCHIVTNEF